MERVDEILNFWFRAGGSARRAVGPGKADDCFPEKESVPPRLLFNRSSSKTNSFFVMSPREKPRSEATDQPWNLSCCGAVNSGTACRAERP